MTNVRVFDKPLFPAPEKGFRVLTKAVPGLVSSEAETVAVTVVALTYVEGMVFPSHWTTVFVTKPAVGLVTVRVISLLPALAVEGARKEMEAPVGF
jgi:hypothetical protein